MGSTSDKASGLANEAIGNVKQGLGKLIDDKEMQANGAAQEAKGEAQQAIGKTKEGVKNVADSISDAAKRNL